MDMRAMRGAATQFSVLMYVLLLSSCSGSEWFSGKKGKESAEQSAQPVTAGAKEVAKDDVILATMAGKPILTIKEYDEQLEHFLVSQPQLRQMVPYIPNFRAEVARSLVSQIVIGKFLADDGVTTQKPEYKRDLSLELEQAQRRIEAKHFRKMLTKPVGAEELKKYYDENKERLPNVLISRGGVPAVGVSFDKEADAKAFLAKAGKSADDLKKAAEAASLTPKMRNFGFVNPQSFGIDAALRDKILASKKAGVELIKVNDKAFWVVNIGAKEEAKYRAFDEVKTMIEETLGEAKLEEALKAKIDELKAKYDVKINEELLKQGQPAAAPMMPGETFMPEEAEQVPAAPGEATRPAEKPAAPAAAAPGEKGAGKSA